MECGANCSRESGTTARVDGKVRYAKSGDMHIAYRVFATARPGEVLTSTTVKDLVAGSGVRFDDRGTHVLKRVPGEWRLFAVTSA